VCGVHNPDPFMLTIAITGGIACGKSLAGRYLSEMGVPVCEADDLARAVLAKGEPVRDRVVESFGPGIVMPDGEIDRAALAALVFGDAGKRGQLNALTHPEIMRRLRAWVSGQSAKSPYVAAVIPLLYEIKDEAHWDVVVCVSAPEAEQRRRLVMRGMTAEEAEARMRSQLRLAEKMERSDYVIFNGGSEMLLEEQVGRVMRLIRGG
jgi:dephospho-CoA kinase